MGGRGDETADGASAPPVGTLTTGEGVDEVGEPEVSEVPEERLVAEQEGKERMARERAEQEMEKAKQQAQEAERRAQEAEAARKRTEKEAERRQGELEERLSKLELQAKQPVADSGPVHSTSVADNGAERAMKNIELGGGVTLEMVYCPGVAEGFWMGKTEVTQEQWERVMGKNPSYFSGKPKNPVETVSWNECQEFVKRVNALPDARASGLRFRLPTEAEWETACRAGAPKRAKYCKLQDGTQITTGRIHIPFTSFLTSNLYCFCGYNPLLSV